MLFLALKKVWVAKITPYQTPTTQENFPSPLLFNAIWKNLNKELLNFFKFIYLFQIKFNFTIENIFSE